MHTFNVLTQFYQPYLTAHSECTLASGIVFLIFPDHFIFPDRVRESGLRITKNARKTVEYNNLWKKKKKKKKKKEEEEKRRRRKKKKKKKKKTKVTKQ